MFAAVFLVLPLRMGFVSARDLREVPSLADVCDKVIMKTLGEQYACCQSDDGGQKLYDVETMLCDPESGEITPRGQFGAENSPLLNKGVNQLIAIYNPITIEIGDVGHAAQSPSIKEAVDPTRCNKNEVGPAEICCGGKIFRKSSDRTCCNYSGKRVYALRQRCFNGRTIDTPEELCNGSVIHLTVQGCCGGVPFNLDKHHVCCTGNLTSSIVPRGSQCCNGLPVGPDEICCGSGPVKKNHPGHTKCCVNSKTGNSITYDSESVICNPETGELKSAASTITLKLPWKPSDLLNVSASRLPTPLVSKARCAHNESDEFAHKMECCGNESYFPDQKTCCGETLFNMSTNESYCCNDIAVLRNSSSSCIGLCGNVTFNKETQVCCNNTTATKYVVPCAKDQALNDCCPST